MRITGIRGFLSRAKRATARPSNPGRWKSVTKSSGDVERMRRIASSAEEAVRHVWLDRRKRRTSVSSRSVSSSTRSIRNPTPD
jgi:hypothetical protein